MHVDLGQHRTLYSGGVAQNEPSQQQFMASVTNQGDTSMLFANNYSHVRNI